MLPKVLWNSLLAAPALLSATLLAGSAIAAEVTATGTTAETVVNDVAATVAPATEVPALALPVAPVEVAQVQPAAPTAVTSVSEISQYSGGSLSQVTSVSQLSDVRPTDWAFQALQNLVERYGCIAGYPDGTYRGNRFMTRYEFAAGLNACLDRVNELIAAGLADAVTEEDLAALRRLQEEFAAELATLRGRVDALEARTAELEANQFSTTTVLRGRTIFAVSDIFGGDDDGVNESEANNTVFQSRVRLNFDTSFTGEDRLRARLQAGNFVDFETDAESAYGDQTDFSFDSGGGNTFSLNRLEYYFPLGDAITVYLEAAGGSPSDIVTTVSPFDDGEQGSLSYFGYNPIYDYYPGEGIGAGFTIDFTDDLQFGAGYLSAEGNDPAPGRGLFNGGYAAFGQLTFSPGDLTAALTYVHSYNGDGLFMGDEAGVTNAYGASVNFALGDVVQIGGWVTYADGIVLEAGGIETWTYAGTLGFADLLKPGSLLGFIVGVPPRVAFATPGARNLGIEREDAALHVEAFYRFPVNDNISITPGVIWLLDPGNNNDNEDVVVGVIRTSFSF